MATVKRDKYLILPEFVYGVGNLGNTCFMNVILQCLNGMPSIVNHYLEKTEMFALNSNTYKFSNIFSSFLANSRLSKSHSGIATDIVSHFNQNGLYKKGEQSDALLFFYSILDVLEKENLLLSQKNSNKSASNDSVNLFNRTFGSKLINMTKCLVCNKETFTQDKQISLPIAFDSEASGDSKGKQNQVKKDKRKNKVQNIIESDDEKDMTKNFSDVNFLAELEQEDLNDDKYFEVLEQWEQESNKNGGYRLIESNDLEIPFIKWRKRDVKEKTQIENLLKMFFGLEYLKDSTLFKCDNCAKNDVLETKAIRGYVFSGQPDTLVINLKRFKQTSNYELHKIDTHVKFETTLDLTNYAARNTNEENKQVYELFAVVMHSGSLKDGHYVCYVKHTLDVGERWFFYNDSVVKEVSTKDVLNSQAFILLYKKVD